MYRHFFKRIFDFGVSFLGIIVLLPFFIIFTLVNAVFVKGNPFFVQSRPGRKGKTFKMVKYRTMNNKKDENGDLLPDKERLTKIGKMIRKLSIDELPELLNILLGQMSIIGPRPLLVRYLPLYTERQATRHNVRPGLTGLAQVSGRNALTWEQKFEKDIFYVENYSFWMDVRIFFLTIKKVLVREGISQNGEATMEFFLGQNENAQIVGDLAEKNDEQKVEEMAEKDSLQSIEVTEEKDSLQIVEGTEKKEYKV